MLSIRYNKVHMAILAFQQHIYLFRYNVII